MRALARRTARLALPAAPLLLLFVALLPARAAALRGDDAATMELRGLLRLRDETFLGHLWEGVLATLEVRLQPFGGIPSQVVIWVFEGHPVAYRIFLVALTVAAALLLWQLARELGLAERDAAFAVLLLVVTIQFRSYHDPMLGYYGGVQMLLLLLLGSLLSFVRALRADRRPWLALGLFVALCGLYEWAFSLAAVYLGLALTLRRGREALRPALPFLVTGGVLVIASLLLRRTGGAEVLAGYKVTLTPLTVVTTYLTQLVAPIPGGALFMEDNSIRFFDLGDGFTRAEWFGAAWRALAVAAGVLLLSRGVTGAAALAPVAVTGALLWATPPLLLAPAPKYQAELTSAKTYLPGLVQAFGAALVFAVVAVALLRAARRRSRIAFRVTALAVAAVAGGAAGLVGLANLRTVALEVPVAETRTLLDEAARRGVFDDLPADTTLMFSQRDMLWPTGSVELLDHGFEALLVDASGRRFDARIAEPGRRFDCPPTPFPPSSCSPLNSSTAIVRVRAFEGGGTVLVSPVDGRRGLRIFRAPLERVRAYTRAPNPPRLVSHVSGGTAWDSSRLRWARTGRGAGWSVHDGTPVGRPPFANVLDEPRSKIDWTAGVPPRDLVRIYGTKRVLP